MIFRKNGHPVQTYLRLCVVSWEIDFFVMNI